MKTLVYKTTAKNKLVKFVYLYNNFIITIFKTENVLSNEPKYFATISNHNKNLEFVYSDYSKLLWCKIDRAINNVIHNKLTELYRIFKEINKI